MGQVITNNIRAYLVILLQMILEPTTTLNGSPKAYKDMDVQYLSGRIFFGGDDEMCIVGRIIGVEMMYPWDNWSSFW